VLRAAPGPIAAAPPQSRQRRWLSGPPPAVSRPRGRLYGGAGGGPKSRTGQRRRTPRPHAVLQAAPGPIAATPPQSRQRRWLSGPPPAVSRPRGRPHGRPRGSGGGPKSRTGRVTQTDTASSRGVAGRAGPSNWVPLSQTSQLLIYITP